MTAATHRALAGMFARDPRITPPAEGRGRFGSNGYKVNGKIFAMFVGGALVVKLPGDEVEVEVAAGHGVRLTMGSRVMREWLVVGATPADWQALAKRACEFVGGDGRSRRRGKSADN